MNAISSPNVALQATALSAGDAASSAEVSSELSCEYIGVEVKKSENTKFTPIHIEIY